MSSPVSGVHPVACGESIGAGLYPASCFFPVIYREIQGKRHVLRRRCSSLAMLAQGRSGDCAQVERDNRQSSGLERGVHLPDAVPLRQVTRQRKQQKRCRLAPSRNARKGLRFPADRIRTCHQSLWERSGHRRAGCRRNAVCYRPNHTAGLDLQILKRQPLGLSLLCGSKPLSSLTSEMQAPQRTHVGATQFGGGERNLTCDPTNRLKL